MKTSMIYACCRRFHLEEDIQRFLSLFGDKLNDGWRPHGRVDIKQDSQFFHYQQFFIKED